MELIVISSPDLIIDSESSIIDHLFQLGLQYFHIRKPMSSVEQLSKLLRGIDPRYYNCISLHQHHQLANEFGIKRLHYTECGRNSSDSKKWQKQKDQGYTLSTSAHDITLLPSLKSFDYIFYGPVFNSISKLKYQSKLSGSFCLDKDHIIPKIIALGGIDAFNLSKIKEMNFDGAAVLGAIWNEPAHGIENFIKLKKNLLVQNSTQ